MRVVTAGIGLWAGRILSTLKAEMPEVEIVGYYDPPPTFLDMIGVNARRYDGVEPILAEAKPDLFCVFSPNLFHLDQIRMGLEAGVHVFTEKPVVVTIEETLELARLLAKHGGVNRCMVGLVLRYSQHMVDLRTALEAGQLDQIVSREANEHIAPLPRRFRHARLAADDRSDRRLPSGTVLPRHRHLQHGHRLASQPRRQFRWPQKLDSCQRPRFKRRGGDFPRQKIRMEFG